VTEILASAGVGFAFGWLLQKAGLSRYERIADVYRFKDLTVVKFLLSALLAGAFTLRLLDAAGLGSSLPVPSTYFAGNVLGGVLFGVGMAASGFCPGTVAAGAGEGRLDYLVPGMLGLVVGALAFGFSYPWVFPLVARDVRPGLTFAVWLGVDPWLVVVLLAEVTFLVFYAIERSGGRRAGEHEGPSEQPRSEHAAQ